MSIRILVVDSHPLVRDGLRFHIQSQPDMEIVAEAGEPTAALRLAQTASPDVAVLSFPRLGSEEEEALHQLAVEFPKTRIIVLCMTPEIEAIDSAIRIGAVGVLSKDRASDDLVTAIRAVHGGHGYLSPAIAGTVLSVYRDLLGARPKPAADSLSGRELAVLKSLAEGLRNKEIAANLNIGTRTVETYRARLMAKLKCRGTTELVRYAIRNGMATV